MSSDRPATRRRPQQPARAARLSSGLLRRGRTGHRPTTLAPPSARSSGDRARASGARGRRFDSFRAHSAVLGLRERLETVGRCARTPGLAIPCGPRCGPRDSPNAATRRPTSGMTRERLEAAAVARCARLWAAMNGLASTPVRTASAGRNEPQSFPTSRPPGPSARRMVPTRPTQRARRTARDSQR